METYKIGDILLHWNSEYELASGKFMERFRCGETFGEDDIFLKGTFEQLSGYTEYPRIGSGDLYDIYDVNGETLLLYHWGYHRNAYGIWISRVEQGRSDVCSFDPAILETKQLPADWFFGISGLQKALLHRGCPVLHASYVEHNGQAILFTAPSGTGKSTQAALWQRYADAQVINGDRAMLGKREGQWYAHGFPACGSSGICENRSLPLCAIVLLEQSPENRVEQLTVSQKVRSIVSGTVLHAWNADEVDRAFALAKDIAEQIPMVRLACRPDEQAVSILRQYLEEQRWLR